MQKGAVSKTDYEDNLEKLARGRITKKPTILSKSYLDFVERELKAKDCLMGEKLSMDKLREHLEDNTFNLDILNKALWNEIEELDF